MINLNEIQIDFINQLQPAECSELDFRKKWAEYEWENKVQVSTQLTDLQEYVHYLATSLNVKLLSQPDDAYDSTCSFLVANLYTKSKFEEDCLINLSIEKTQMGSDQKIQGLIRVRAKTEGMAICLGEKCKQIK